MIYHNSSLDASLFDSLSRSKFTDTAMTTVRSHFLFESKYCCNLYNRHNLPLARHAANEYGGWVKIVKWLGLTRKLVGLASIERVTV